MGKSRWEVRSVLRSGTGGGPCRMKVETCLPVCVMGALCVFGKRLEKILRSLHARKRACGVRGYVISVKRCDDKGREGTGPVGRSGPKGGRASTPCPKN